MRAKSQEQSKEQYKTRGYTIKMKKDEVNSNKKHELTMEVSL